MIEIIPKQETKGILGSGTVLIIGIVLFALCAGGFVIFLQLQSQTKKTIVNLQNFLTAGTTASERSLEQEVLTYQKKISDFGVFAQKRTAPLRFFQFLEQYTHPKVFFTNVQFDIAANHMVLQGESADSTSLEQQLTIFRKQAGVQSVTLANVHLELNGRFTFSLDIVFSSL